MTNRRSDSVRFVHTGRDVEIAADLFAHRALSRDQLIALGRFGSVPRCNARMARLVLAGWARRFEHALRGSRAQHLYGPGPAAAPKIAERLGAGLEDVLGPCRRSVAPLFLEHTLALGDLRIVFEKRARLAGAGGFRWLPEALCRHEYSLRTLGGAWRKRVFQPDACFRMSGPDRVVFVELDLGNVSMPAFERKVVSYREYLGSGVFGSAYRAESFGVLVLGTTARRIEALSQVAKRVGGRSPVFEFARIAEAGDVAARILGGSGP